MAATVTNSTASALYGAGNSRISAEQIKAFINAPGRTAAEIQSAAEANGVSVEQISQAMAGNKRFSAQSISSYLATQGIKPAPAPASKTAAVASPATAAATLFGAGNPEISDAEIQDYINQPGRTPEQVLAGALANGISAAQIARAMAGHADYTLAHITQSLANQGISSADAPTDPLDFRAETLFGTGNPAISDAQIQEFVNQPGVSSEQILAAAIEHGLSAEQIAAALPDRPEFSLENITNYIEAQGIATQRDPSRYVNLQSSALYGQGNAAISDAEIQAYINQPGRSEEQILNAALANGVSLAQITRAMDGQAAFTLDNLNDVVGFKQDTSALEVLLLRQAQLLKELDAAQTTQATQKALDALHASLARLEPQLEAARAQVDARIAQGQAQDQVAADAENAAAALKAQFDTLQLERLHAQAAIDEQQAQVDAAQLEINAAQAALDQANQDIAAAAGIKKKSRRHRARGEAQAIAAAAQEALSAAQQKLAGLQPGLTQAQAAASGPIAAAQALQVQWEAAQKIADTERNKSNALFGRAQRAVQLEVALKQGLASTQTALLKRSHSKAAQLQAQIDAGELKGTARTDALKSIALDTQEATELTQRIDAQAAADRIRESTLAQAAVPAQTQALGSQLIAENLIGDAAQLGQVQAEVQAQLSQAQGELTTAAARLLNAKLALAKADFAVDWDQAKKDLAKSSKAIALDQPQLDAAQAELNAAQQAVDQAQAQVNRLQHLATPLGAATLDAGFAAGSAMQRAAVAATQANAATGWVQLAQTRVDSSADASSALNPNATADAVAAAQTTRAEQARQNDLAIQAGATQILSSFLQDKAAHASQAYTQAQAQLAVQQDDFQQAASAAGARAPDAEAARQQLAQAEQNAAFAFAVSRSKLNPEQLQAAQADPAGFVQTWQERELAERKDARKQSHLFDDLAQFQNADPAVQAARQHVLDTGHALAQASQSAIDAGDRAQASLVMAGLLGQAAVRDQAQLAQASAAVGSLSAQAGAHALVLGQAAQAEVAALNDPDSAVAQLVHQIAAQMPQNAADWNQAAAAWQAQAATETGTLQTLQTQFSAAQSQRSEHEQSIQTSLAEQTQVHAFALGVLKEVADRDQQIQEQHQDRQLMDAAHKRAKKGGLFKILMQVGVALAGAIATIASLGTLGPEVALLETAFFAGEVAATEVALGAAAEVAVGVAAGAVPQTIAGQALMWAGAGLAGNVTTQGLNLALGLQDNFSFKHLGLATLSAGLTGGLLGGAPGQWMTRGLLGTLESLGVPAIAEGLAPTLLQRSALGLSQALPGVVINTGVQGAMVGIGLQERFDWPQVAAFGITAGLGGATNDIFNGWIQNLTGWSRTVMVSAHASVMNALGMAASGTQLNAAQLAQAIQGTPGALGGPRATPRESGGGNGGFGVAFRNPLAAPRPEGAAPTPRTVFQPELATTTPRAVVRAVPSPVVHAGEAGSPLKGDAGISPRAGDAPAPLTAGQRQLLDHSSAALGRSDAPVSPLKALPESLLHETLRPPQAPPEPAHGVAGAHLFGPAQEGGVRHAVVVERAQPFDRFAQSQGLSRSELAVITGRNGLEGFKAKTVLELPQPQQLAQLRAHPEFTRAVQAHETAFNTYVQQKAAYETALQNQKKQQQLRAHSLDAQAMGVAAERIGPSSPAATPAKPVAALSTEQARAHKNALFAPNAQDGFHLHDKPAARFIEPLREAPTYGVHKVVDGDDLPGVAQKTGVPEHEIAAFNDLAHFRLERGRELAIPGPEIRMQPGFQATARWYKTQYARYSALYGAPDFTLMRKPQKHGDTLRVGANTLNVITDQGLVTQSSKIILDADKAQLQHKVNTRGLELQQEKLHQDYLERHADDGGGGGSRRQRQQREALENAESLKDVPNLGNRVGSSAEGTLVPMHIDLDAGQARSREQTALNAEKTRLVLGPNDKGRWGNKAESALGHHSAALAGAMEVLGQLSGKLAWQREAMISRQSREHRSEQAGQRWTALGGVSDYRQIYNAGDLGLYAGGLLVDSLPYMVDIAAGAGTGGALWGLRGAAALPNLMRVRMGAAGAAGYLPGVGDLSLAQHRQGAGTNIWAALGLGVPFAALNLFGVEGMAARLSLARNAIKRLDAVNGVKGGAMRTAATGGITGTTEMVSEVGQGALERWSEVAVDPGQAFFSKAFMHELPNMAVGAFLLGGGMGSIGGGWRRSAEYVAQVQPVLNTYQRGAALGGPQAAAPGALYYGRTIELDASQFSRVPDQGMPAALPWRELVAAVASNGTPMARPHSGNVIYADFRNRPWGSGSWRGQGGASQQRYAYPTPEMGDGFGRRAQPHPTVFSSPVARLDGLLAGARLDLGPNGVDVDRAPTPDELKILSERASLQLASVSIGGTHRIFALDHGSSDVPLTGIPWSPAPSGSYNGQDRRAHPMDHPAQDDGLHAAAAPRSSAWTPQAELDAQTRAQLGSTGVYVDHQPTDADLRHWSAHWGVELAVGSVGNRYRLYATAPYDALDTLKSGLPLEPDHKARPPYHGEEHRGTVVLRAAGSQTQGQTQPKDPHTVYHYPPADPSQTLHMGSQGRDGSGNGAEVVNREWNPFDALDMSPSNGTYSGVDPRYPDPHPDDRLLNASAHSTGPGESIGPWGQNGSRQNSDQATPFDADFDPNFRFTHVVAREVATVRYSGNAQAALMREVISPQTGATAYRVDLVSHDGNQTTYEFDRQLVENELVMSPRGELMVYTADNGLTIARGDFYTTHYLPRGPKTAQERKLMSDRELRTYFDSLRTTTASREFIGIDALDQMYIHHQLTSHIGKITLDFDGAVVNANIINNRKEFEVPRGPDTHPQRDFPGVFTLIGGFLPHRSPELGPETTVDHLLHSPSVLVPGIDGVKVDRQITPDELLYLAQKLGMVEIGSSKEDGEFYLYSGNFWTTRAENRSRAPQRLVFLDHNHPKTSDELDLVPSDGDKAVVKRHYYETTLKHFPQARLEPSRVLVDIDGTAIGQQDYGPTRDVSNAADYYNAASVYLNTGLLSRGNFGHWSQFQYQNPNLQIGVRRRNGTMGIVRVTGLDGLPDAGTLREGLFALAEKYNFEVVTFEFDMSGASEQTRDALLQAMEMTAEVKYDFEDGKYKSNDRIYVWHEKVSEPGVPVSNATVWLADQQQTDSRQANPYSSQSEGEGTDAFAGNEKEIEPYQGPERRTDQPKHLKLTADSEKGQNPSQPIEIDMADDGRVTFVVGGGRMGSAPGPDAFVAVIQTLLAHGIDFEEISSITAYSEIGVADHLHAGAEFTVVRDKLRKKLSQQEAELLAASSVWKGGLLRELGFEFTRATTRARPENRTRAVAGVYEFVLSKIGAHSTPQLEQWRVVPPESATHANPEVAPDELADIAEKTVPPTGAESDAEEAQQRLAWNEEVLKASGQPESAHSADYEGWLFPHRSAQMPAVVSMAELLAHRDWIPGAEGVALAEDVVLADGVVDNIAAAKQLANQSGAVVVLAKAVHADGSVTQIVRSGTPIAPPRRPAGEKVVALGFPDLVEADTAVDGDAGSTSSTTPLKDPNRFYEHQDFDDVTGTPIEHGNAGPVTIVDNLLAKEQPGALPADGLLLDRQPTDKELSVLSKNFGGIDLLVTPKMTEAGVQYRLYAKKGLAASTNSGSSHQDRSLEHESNPLNQGDIDDSDTANADSSVEVDVPASHIDSTPEDDPFASYTDDGIIYIPRSDEEVSEDLVKGIMPPEIREVMSIPEDDQPEIQALKEKVGEIAAKIIARNKLDPEIYTPDIYISADDKVNAMIVPSAKKPILVLTLGLLWEVRTEDELAGVIGHELGHKYFHEKTTGAENGGPSKVEEFGADGVAIMLLEDSGFNPKGLITLAERFGEENFQIINVDDIKNAASFDEKVDLVRRIADPHPSGNLRIRSMEDAIVALGRSRGKVGVDRIQVPLEDSFYSDVKNVWYESPITQRLDDIEYIYISEEGRIATLVELVKDIWPPTNETAAKRVYEIFSYIETLQVDFSSPKEADAFMELADLIMGNWQIPEGKYVVSPTGKILDIFDILYSPLKEAWINGHGISRQSGQQIYVARLADLKTAVEDFTDARSAEEAEIFAKQIIEVGDKIGADLKNIDIRGFYPPTEEMVKAEIEQNGSWTPPYKKHVDWYQKTKSENIKKVLWGMSLGADPWVAGIIGHKPKSLGNQYDLYTIPSAEGNNTKADTDEINYQYLTALDRDSEGRIIKLIQPATAYEWKKLSTNADKQEIATLHTQEAKHREAHDREMAEQADWNLLRTNFQKFIAKYGVYLVPNQSLVPTKYPFAERFFGELRAALSAENESYKKQVSALLHDYDVGINFPPIANFYNEENHGWKYSNVPSPGGYTLDHPLIQFITSEPGKTITDDYQKLAFLKKTNGFITPGETKKFGDIFQLPLADILNYPRANSVKEFADKIAASKFNHIALAVEAERLAHQFADSISMEDLFVLDKVAISGAQFSRYGNSNINSFFQELRHQVAERHLQTDDLSELIKTYRYAVASRLILEPPALKEDAHARIKGKIETLPEEQRLEYLRELLRPESYDIHQKIINISVDIFRPEYDGYIEDPKFRNWVVEQYSTALANKVSQDDGTSEYAARAKETVADVNQNTSGITQLSLLSAFAKEVNAQQELAYHIRDIYEKHMASGALSQHMTAIVGELQINETSRDPQLRNLVLDFLSSPLTKDGRKPLLQYVKTDYEQSTRSTSEVLADYQLQNYHKNFWAAPLEMRTAYLEKIAFPLTSEGPEQIEIIRKLIGDAFPSSHGSEAEIERNENAQKIVTAYLSSADLAERRLLATAMLAANMREEGAPELTVGQKLYTVLSHMGPAGGKLMQAIHSHSQTPQDIKNDLASSKTNYDLPMRWDVVQAVEDSGLLAEEHPNRVQHIGKVEGSGSFGITVFNTLNDGREVADTFLRPHAADRAEREFKMMLEAATDLSRRIPSMKPLIGMVEEARRSAKVETDMSVAVHQNQLAQNAYDGITVTVEQAGKSYEFTHHVTSLLDHGDNFKRVSIASGIHFNDLLESTQEEISYKQAAAKAILAAQLLSRFSGVSTDLDRHGGNVKIDEGRIYHFDFGAMNIVPLTTEDKAATGRILAQVVRSVGMGEGFNESMIRHIDGADVFQATRVYLNGLKKDILALGDYINSLSGDDLSAIFAHSLTAETVDPEIRGAFNKEIGIAKILADRKLNSASQSAGITIERRDISENSTPAPDKTQARSNPDIEPQKPHGDDGYQFPKLAIDADGLGAAANRANLPVSRPFEQNQKPDGSNAPVRNEFARSITGLADYPGAPVGQPALVAKIKMPEGSTSFQFVQEVPANGVAFAKVEMAGSVDRSGVLEYTIHFTGSKAQLPSEADLFAAAVTKLKHNGIDVVGVRARYSSHGNGSQKQFLKALEYLDRYIDTASEAELRFAVSQSGMGPIYKEYGLAPKSARADNWGFVYADFLPSGADASQLLAPDAYAKYLERQQADAKPSGAKLKNGNSDGLTAPHIDLTNEFKRSPPEFPNGKVPYTVYYTYAPEAGHGLSSTIKNGVLVNVASTRGNQQTLGSEGDMVRSVLKRAEIDGVPVRAISEWWNGDANRKEYEANIKSGMSKADAAANTESGRLFDALGFTEIYVSNGVGENGVSVVFSRPDAPVVSSEPEVEQSTTAAVPSADNPALNNGKKPRLGLNIKGTYNQPTPLNPDGLGSNSRAEKMPADNTQAAQATGAAPQANDQFTVVKNSYGTNIIKYQGQNSRFAAVVGADGVLKIEHLQAGEGDLSEVDMLKQALDLSEQQGVVVGRIKNFISLNAKGRDSEQLQRALDSRGKKYLNASHEDFVAALSETSYAKIYAQVGYSPEYVFINGKNAEIGFSKLKDKDTSIKSSYAGVPNGTKVHKIDRNLITRFNHNIDAYWAKNISGGTTVRIHAIIGANRYNNSDRMWEALENIKYILKKEGIYGAVTFELECVRTSQYIASPDFMMGDQRIQNYDFSNLEPRPLETALVLLKGNLNEPTLAEKGRGLLRLGREFSEQLTHNIAELHQKYLRAEAPAISPEMMELYVAFRDPRDPAAQKEAIAQLNRILPNDPAVRKEVFAQLREEAFAQRNQKLLAGQADSRSPQEGAAENTVIKQPEEQAQSLRPSGDESPAPSPRLAADKPPGRLPDGSRADSFLGDSINKTHEFPHQHEDGTLPKGSSANRNTKTGEPASVVTVDSKALAIEQHGKSLNISLPDGTTAKIDSDSGVLSLPYSDSLNPEYYDSIAQIAGDRDVPIKTIRHSFEIENLLSEQSPLVKSLGSTKRNSIYGSQLEQGISKGDINGARTALMSAISNAYDGIPADRIWGGSDDIFANFAISDLRLDSSNGKIIVDFLNGAENSQNLIHIYNDNRSDVPPHVAEALDHLLTQLGYDLSPQPGASTVKQGLISDRTTPIVDSVRNQAREFIDRARGVASKIRDGAQALYNATPHTYRLKPPTPGYRAVVPIDSIISRYHAVPAGAKSSASVDKVAASIKEKGFNPDDRIEVVQLPDKSKLLMHGQVRLEAARRAGKTDIPVYVNYLSQVLTVELMKALGQAELHGFKVADQYQQEVTKLLTPAEKEEVQQYLIREKNRMHNAELDASRPPK